MEDDFISAEKLDEIFDDGEEDVLQYFDIDNPGKPNQELKNLSIEIPLWLMNSLSVEADKQGITLEKLVEKIICEKLV
jgi:hypothetical protein